QQHPARNAQSRISTGQSSTSDKIAILGELSPQHLLKRRIAQLQCRQNALTVTVMSFSYRKGIPYDPTGNGGGFVFDCRAIHNPGRYEKYTKFTGKDAEVIDFFAKEPEMAEFVQLTQRIVEISVKKYLKRGFKSLSVLFGCTGGQHRSVFCAERMAEFLRKNYPQVIVNLSHREQDR
ncbi:MAG: hypothetical protein II480_13135, partial [Bacteroidales bacterium]|nr:hypothetical protein [Bacteroidales bacterium]